MTLVFFLSGFLAGALVAYGGYMVGRWAERRLHDEQVDGIKLANWLIAQRRSQE